MKDWTTSIMVLVPVLGLIGLLCLVTALTAGELDNKKHKTLVYIFFSGIMLLAIIPLLQLLLQGIDAKDLLPSILVYTNVFTQWIFVLIGIRLLFVKQVHPLFKIIVVLYSIFIGFYYLLFWVISQDGMAFQPGFG